MKTSLSQISFQVEEPRHRRLKAYAAARGLTIRDVLEAAIDQILLEDTVIDEKALESEWKNSAALREEFGTLDVFKAYRKAVARGLTRELKPRKEANHGQS